MREISPGDLVFSFEGTYIRAIGVARSNAYESPKPPEFGKAGPNWDAIGWRVDVKYYPLNNQIRPADYMSAIRPELPPRYSPLQSNGRGNQGVYLTFVPPRLVDVLFRSIGPEAEQLHTIVRSIEYPAEVDYREETAIGLVEWEEHLINDIRSNLNLSETERETLILARRGQGVFKKNVMQVESQCRITKVDRAEHLRASHIKPWRDCGGSDERLSAANGLLLTPSVDHLFDRGFVSFEDNGDLLISPAAHLSSLEKMGIITAGSVNVGGFNTDQRFFLNYHREEVFLRARVTKRVTHVPQI
ncbi:MAG: HNH endonuclease [Pseudohongiellaceae bacterium]